MAEKLASGGSVPYGSEYLGIEDAVSSDEDCIDPLLEKEQLERHQQNLRKSGVPQVPSRKRRPYPNPTSITVASSRPLPVPPFVGDDADGVTTQVLNYAAAVGRTTAPCHGGYGWQVWWPADEQHWPAETKDCLHPLREGGHRLQGPHCQVGDVPPGANPCPEAAKWGSGGHLPHSSGQGQVSWLPFLSVIHVALGKQGSETHPLRG